VSRRGEVLKNGPEVLRRKRLEEEKNCRDK
jgi:hypothetical protein